MANHCVYETCFACGGDWCVRGCNYDACRDGGCGKYAKDPVKEAAERERMKRAEEELARNMPDGWF